MATKNMYNPNYKGSPVNLMIASFSFACYTHYLEQTNCYCYYLDEDSHIFKCLKLFPTYTYYQSDNFIIINKFSSQNVR